jgi:hypothetical protein
MQAVLVPEISPPRIRQCLRGSKAPNHRLPIVHFLRTATSDRTVPEVGECCLP